MFKLTFLIRFHIEFVENSLSYFLNSLIFDSFLGSTFSAETIFEFYNCKYCLVFSSSGLYLIDDTICIIF